MSARKKINWPRLRWAAKEAISNMTIFIGMALVMLPAVLAALTETFWFLLLYPIIIFVLAVWDLYDGS